MIFHFNEYLTYSYLSDHISLLRLAEHFQELILNEPSWYVILRFIKHELTPTIVMAIFSYSDYTFIDGISYLRAIFKFAWCSPSSITFSMYVFIIRFYNVCICLMFFSVIVAINTVFIIVVSLSSNHVCLSLVHT